jgi:hypothetical protein
MNEPDEQSWGFNAERSQRDADGIWMTTSLEDDGGFIFGLSPTGPARSWTKSTSSPAKAPASTASGADSSNPSPPADTAAEDRPELVWKPSPDRGYLRSFAVLRAIADSGDL